MLNPLSWFKSSGSVPNGTHQEEDILRAIRKASAIDRVHDSYSRKTDKLAVSTIPAPWEEDKERGGIMAQWANTGFRDYLKFNMNENKFSRIVDLRTLSKEEKIESCLHEIAISCLASHDGGKTIKVKLEGDYSDEVKEIINEELELVVDYFKFDEHGQKYFKEWLICGEVAFENVFSIERPELGILDVKSIPPENIDPIYRNQYNEEVEAYILRKPLNQLDNPNNRFTQQNRRTQPTLAFETIPMAVSQVTYCNSGEWDESMHMVIPYITKGQDAQKKLSLIEDSIVINAMVNAPERLLWNIPTGDMDASSQNTFMRNIINSHKRRKGTDGKGNILDKYDPISITEDIYIPVSNDGKSATVTRLAGSTAFSGGFNGMLDYFHQKVFEDMHVPIARLNPDASQSDGQTITMQELAFAERIIAIQKRMASAIKKTLITHLKLKGIKLHRESCDADIILESRSKDQEISREHITDEQRFQSHLKLVESGYYKDTLRNKLLTEDNEKCDKLLYELGLSYWDQYELRERDIFVEFSLPTSFMALRDQQQFDLKWNNFNTMASTGFFSVYLLAKQYLEMSDSEILHHIEWKKKEAEKNWEIAQIESEGPDFRENAMADAGLDAGGGDFGGMDDFGGDMGDMGDFDGGDVGGGDDGVGDTESALPPMDTEPDTGGAEPDTGGDEGGITEA